MIYISHNTPSSKNSKQWTGKMLINSPTVRKYKKATQGEWEANKALFLDQVKDKPKPYRIGFYYVRDSKRKFDFGNACQIVQDLMKEYGWIDDDNCDELLPYPYEINNSVYHIDKPNAGVHIYVL